MSSVIVTTYQNMGSLSTLELMLEELQQPEENTNDLPPPLPVRPITKARLPKGRRKLPEFGKEKNRDEEDGYSQVKCGLFESTRTKEDVFLDQPVHQWDSAERDSVAMTDKFCLVVDLREGAELSAVVGIQRCFRGYQARRYYHQIKIGVVALQQFVRGEIARKYHQDLTRRLTAIIIIQKHIKEHRHRRIERQLTAATRLQSVVRGWLTRKQFNLLGNGKPTCDQNIRKKNDHAEKEQETKVPRSVLLDLQRHILRTEAALERKKEENAALRLHIQHYEKKWNQYESKMKAMEKMWQDQLTSVQTSLAAERKTHSGEKTKGELRLLMHQDQDEDDGFPRTTSLQSSALNLSNEVHDSQSQQNGRINSENQLNNHHVMDMVNHFQNFVHDQCKSGQETSTLRPNDELQKLKVRFEAWKKDYKSKLREVKATMKQLGHPERGKGTKIWCGR
ncbi:myosin-3-like [Nicotiana tabacum]|uniref:Myosin-3-like n=2 Tax=Nicotiana TaxID=4085 RepID=A0A1S3YC32_TOBAC|nr:PREDICTED: myosin-2-like [Nicotiana sylvestris]XP_016449568.1 PREDICTED: myosin-3-like [Nicotiana tabacum]